MHYIIDFFFLEIKASVSTATKKNFFNPTYKIKKVIFAGFQDFCCTNTNQTQFGMASSINMYLRQKITIKTHEVLRIIKRSDNTHTQIQNIILHQKNSFKDV